MSSFATKRYTVDEYLAIEMHGEIKHEYFDGEIFDMAGAKASQNVAAGNLIAALHAAARKRGCLVMPSDMMVWCPTGLRTYPDVSVVCDKPRYESDKEVTLLNPLVIVEVLSESTAAYDRGKKFDHYKTIESLIEYVLVTQDEAHVDHFARQPGGKWLLSSASKLTDVIDLPILECSIPLAEIYANVTFEDQKKEADETASGPQGR